MTRCAICLSTARDGAVCEACTDAMSSRAGTQVVVRRRVVPRLLTASQWAILDVLGSVALATGLVAQTAGLPVDVATAQLSNLRAARLVETEPSGWLLTASGRVAVQRREAPPRVKLVSESSAANRRRQARFRERRRAQGGGDA